MRGCRQTTAFSFSDAGKNVKIQQPGVKLFYTTQLQQKLQNIVFQFVMFLAQNWHINYQKTENKDNLKLKVMKTTNNAQKTETRKFKTGILALALLLSTVNSNGQAKEFQKPFGNDRQIAYAASQYNSGKHETIRVQVKNERSFMSSTEGSEFVRFEPEAENSLQIEAWMLGNKYFTSERPQFGTDAETPLKIEGWMTDSRVWNK